MMAPRYHIDLFWYEPDDCWIANVPDLRSCSAHGETPEEALAELQIAIEGWLEVARECGMTIPEPQYRHTSLAA
jgi:predicted RNase H-like HicB family nuclease